jgi:hypothetical protein
MHIYIHDVEEEMLYALPEEPTVTPKNNRYGETKAWKVHVDLEVSTPNNQFKKRRWKIPQSQTYKNEYPTSRKQPDFVAAFKADFYPEGKMMNQREYETLKQEYDEKSGINW